MSRKGRKVYPPAAAPEAARVQGVKGSGVCFPATAFGYNRDRYRNRDEMVNFEVDTDSDNSMAFRRVSNPQIGTEF